MNRKQRNKRKREAHIDWWVDGISLFATTLNGNQARTRARQRLAFHKHADWLCHKNADLGYLACDRCHWYRRCKAMRTNSHPRSW